jgi:hypothetical protein
MEEEFFQLVGGKKFGSHYALGALFLGNGKGKGSKPQP